MVMILQVKFHTLMSAMSKAHKHKTSNKQSTLILKTFRRKLFNETNQVDFALWRGMIFKLELKGLINMSLVYKLVV